jgi:hypothetical protein
MGTTQFWSVPYAFYAGRSGSSTFFAGSVNPSASQGQNGDFYLNITSYTLFGPKSNGGMTFSWNTPHLGLSRKVGTFTKKISFWGPGQGEIPLEALWVASFFGVNIHGVNSCQGYSTP